jgi:hypothetical protein
MEPQTWYLCPLLIATREKASRNYAGEQAQFTPLPGQIEKSKQGE